MADERDGEKAISPLGDTLYEISPAVPAAAGAAMVNATSEKLHETTVEERKQLLLYQASQAVARRSYKTKTRKVSARAAISVLDHRDEILGLLERLLEIAVSWLVYQHDWLAAIVFTVVAGLVWLLKVQKPEPGPIVAFFKQDARAMRAQLADLSRTIYQ